METTIDAAPMAKPLWKRITEFPLVAMLIAVILYMLVLVITGAILKLGLPALASRSREMVGDLIAIPLLVVIYKLAIRHLGSEPRDDFRLKGAVRDTLVGLGIGAAIMTAAVAIAAMLDVYNIVGEGDTRELSYAIVTAALFPAVSEELMFRGILFRWIEDFGGSWVALAITSALFGLAHFYNPNATAFSSFAIAVEAGVLLGGAYMLTRSLWMPMGLHAAWNFTQGEIFDVNVSGLDVHGLVTAKMSGPELLSGGHFGLEASIIGLVIATLAGVWLVVLAIRNGELVQPWWVRRRLDAPTSA